jgi:GxxExxY protein
MDREGEIKVAIEVCYSVLDELGPGFPERIYERAVELVLNERGIAARSRVPICVWFHGQIIGSFEADLVLPSDVIFEFKVGSAIERWHEAQALSYLRCTCAELAYVVVFGPALRYRRFILENVHKKGVKGDGFRWKP